jgi:hypothetical protein
VLAFEGLGVNPFSEIPCHGGSVVADNRSQKSRAWNLVSCSFEVKERRRRVSQVVC